MNRQLPDHIIEKIDSYLQGKLEGKALDSFLDMVKEDTEIAEELNYRANISKASKIYGAQKLKNHLSRLFKREKRVKSGNKIITILIGLLIILLSAYFMLSKKEKTNSPNELFAENYAIYSWNYGQRSQNIEKVLAIAQQSYASGKYQMAFTKLIAIPDSLTNDEILLATAITAYEIDSSALALSMLKPIYNNNQSLYRDHARWYAALIHVKNEDIQIARSLLLPLTEDPRADHHEEAIELVHQLRRLE